MGKSVHGALWLDPDKTSPYQFRQYWIQLPDDDVERFLLQLTLRSVDDVAAIVAEHRAAPEKRIGQRALATDVTALVHGADAERAAAEAADVLFGGDPTRASRAALDAVAREVPSTTMSRAQLNDLVAVLTTTQLAQANSDARRTLGQKGFRANGQTIADDTDLAAVSLLAGEYLLLRRGKTQHHLVRVEG